jgi:hypothetical protein
MADLWHRGKLLGEGVISPGRDPTTGVFRLEFHAPDNKGAQLWMSQEEVVHIISRLQKLLEYYNYSHNYNKPS